MDDTSRTASYQSWPGNDQAELDEYLRNRAADTVALANDQPLDEYILGGSRYGPPQTFNVSTRLVWGCAALDCSKTQDLSPCSTCKVTEYCSHQHQYGDRPRHRSVCGKIKKAQAHFEKEDRALRRSEGDVFFRGGWGELWGIPESRGYMRARVTLVEALLRTNTARAVTSSLDHLLDMLRLCRMDPIGARDVVPTLYLRLGRDQDAYDFCKWWATTGHDSNYDWGNISASYIDTKNADAFEQVDVFFGDRFYLSHVIAITLLKLRLLIDLKSLQRAREIAGPHVPRETLDAIQQYCTSSAITSNLKIVEREDQSPHIIRLHKQVKELYAAVEKANSHFWPALIEPADSLRARPISYGDGDKGQMQVTLQNSYNAWVETLGAIDVIKELSKENSHSLLES